jgi:hypothetical protein
VEKLFAFAFYNVFEFSQAGYHGYSSAENKRHRDTPTQKEKELIPPGYEQNKTDYRNDRAYQ